LSNLYIDFLYEIISYYFYTTLFYLDYYSNFYSLSFSIIPSLVKAISILFLLVSCYSEYSYIGCIKSSFSFDSSEFYLVNSLIIDLYFAFDLLIFCFTYFSVSCKSMTADEISSFDLVLPLKSMNFSTLIVLVPSISMFNFYLLFDLTSILLESFDFTWVNLLCDPSPFWLFS